MLESLAFTLLHHAFKRLTSKQSLLFKFKMHFYWVMFTVCFHLKKNQQSLLDNNPTLMDLQIINTLLKLKLKNLSANLIWPVLQINLGKIKMVEHKIKLTNRSRMKEWDSLKSLKALQPKTKMLRNKNLKNNLRLSYAKRSKLLKMICLILNLKLKEKVWKFSKSSLVEVK